MAATVNADPDDWFEIRGLQIEGKATELGADERSSALAIYLAKFPTLEVLYRAPVGARQRVIGQRLDASSFYRVVPAWIRLIDNSLGFAHKEELLLPSRSSR